VGGLQGVGAHSMGWQARPVSLELWCWKLHLLNRAETMGGGRPLLPSLASLSGAPAKSLVRDFGVLSGAEEAEKRRQDPPPSQMPALRSV